MKQRFESCSDFQASLPLWAGGDLDPEENFAIQDHLETCEPCLAAAEQADHARRALALRLEGEVGPTPDLWGAVRVGLVQEGLVAAPILGGAAFWLRRAGVGAAAAAAAVLLTLTWSGHLGGEVQEMGSPAANRGGVGGLAATPALPTASQPVFNSDPGLLGSSEAPAVLSKSRRLRRLSPGEAERWSDAEFLRLEHLRELSAMEIGSKKSDLVLTGGH